jgi:hypothetical protein
VSHLHGRAVRGILAAVLLAAAWWLVAGVRATAPTQGAPAAAPCPFSGPVAPPPPSPSPWPRFAPPRALLVANGLDLSPDELLVATTLQGLYNRQDGPCRLYLVQSPGDLFWLRHAVPRGVRLVYLTPHDDAIDLPTLLRDFAGVARGAVLADPANPDTVNLATTIAGLEGYVAAEPSDLPALRAAGIPVRLDLLTLHLSGPVATYAWAVAHLLPATSRRLLVELNPTVTGSLRDYAVATRAFVYYLTSTDPAQQALLHQILAHTPADTPVMGYIPNEGPDVADLSAAGHFLNASDFLHNESVWAAMPAPSRLPPRPQPQPVAVRPDTVYVAFLVSDGDNAQYVQHRMRQVWTSDPNLGAVPEGWTIPPGMIDFAPTILEYYARHLPRDSEFVAGPSGVGYATAMAGPDLTRFARLTAAYLARDGVYTVDDWESPADAAPYAQASQVVSLSLGTPYAPELVGHTLVAGQTSGYVSSGSALFCTILQQTLGAPSGRPVFLQPLVDAWNLTPTTVLHVAQSLAAEAGLVGRRFVFLTPTEWALTLEAYLRGDGAAGPATNAEAVAGSTLLRGGTAPYYPVEVGRPTGPNLVANPSGASGTDGWSLAFGGADASLQEATYQGSPALEWHVGAIGHPDWVSAYPAVQDGSSYAFSVEVAGHGQVYLDVWDGTEDLTTVPVRLTPRFQRLTWTVTIPAQAPGGQAGAAPQLQVREAGVAPVDVFFRDAEVRALNLPPPTFETLYMHPCVVARG